MEPLRVVVVTSLFPSAVRPQEGIFALRRWAQLVRRGHRVRVLHVLPWAPPLVARGWRAELRRMAPVETLDGVEVRRPRYLHLPGARHAAGNAGRFARAAARSIRRASARAGPELFVPGAIVADYAWPAAALARHTQGLGAPLIVSGRGSDVLQVAGEAGLADELGACLALADGWCGVSEELVQRMDELGGRPGRGVLVPNGVDAERFRPPADAGERARARRRFELEGDAPTVLCVGHLIPRKDPLAALEAFERGAPAEARLLFVGAGELGSELEAAVAARGLAGRVRLLGELDPEALAEAYRAGDALLLASVREGRPNVVLEALAAGLPIAARPSGGTPELLRHAPGCLAAGPAPADLARALEFALGPDAPGPDVQRAAVAELTWERSAEILVQLLQRAYEEYWSA